MNTKNAFGFTFARQALAILLQVCALHGELKLQSANNLQGIGGWADVREQPVEIDEQFQVTIQSSEPSRFFRLVRR